MTLQKSNIENVYLSWIINKIADTEHCLAELMNVNCNVNKYINLQLNNYLVAFLEPRFFHEHFYEFMINSFLISGVHEREC